MFPPNFRLIPLSPLAITVTDPISLPQSFVIGRNVQNSAGLRLNQEWIQFSQTHCRVYFSDVEGMAPSWMVQDTSTNGTWLNEIRIQKGSSAPISEGDILRLSTPPGEVLEFKFLAEEGILSEDKEENLCRTKRKANDMLESSLAPEQPQHQRHHSPGLVPLSPVHPAHGAAGVQEHGASSTPRTAIPSPHIPFSSTTRELSQYEKQIQDLQRKLAWSRRQADESKAELHILKGQVAQRQESQELKLQEVEKKAQERSAAYSEAMAKELDAVKLRAAEALGRQVEAEALAAAEGTARATLEGQLVAMQIELAMERDSSSQVRSSLEELQSKMHVLRQQLAATAAERDQAEIKRGQESDMRARAQEEVSSLVRDVSAQQEAKEAAHRAVEQCQAQVQEVLGELLAERKARAAAQVETTSKDEQLRVALRKSEELEERLLTRETEVTFKRLRATEVARLADHASGEVSRLLSQLQEYATELAASPCLDFDNCSIMSLPLLGGNSEAQLPGGEPNGQLHQQKLQNEEAPSVPNALPCISHNLHVAATATGEVLVGPQQPPSLVNSMSQATQATGSQGFSEPRPVTVQQQQQQQHSLEMQTQVQAQGGHLPICMTMGPAAAPLPTQLPHLHSCEVQGSEMQGVQSAMVGEAFGSSFGLAASSELHPDPPGGFSPSCLEPALGHQVNIFPSFTKAFAKGDSVIKGNEEAEIEDLDGMKEGDPDGMEAETGDDLEEDPMKDREVERDCGAMSEEEEKDCEAMSGSGCERCYELGIDQEQQEKEADEEKGLMVVAEQEGDASFQMKTDAGLVGSAPHSFIGSRSQGGQETDSLATERTDWMDKQAGLSLHRQALVNCGNLPDLPGGNMLFQYEGQPRNSLVLGGSLVPDGSFGEN